MCEGGLDAQLRELLEHVRRCVQLASGGSSHSYTVMATLPLA